jgi:hypothetical protein
MVMGFADQQALDAICVRYFVMFQGTVMGGFSGWGASSAGVPSADPLNCVAMVIVLPAAPKLPVSNT